MDDIEQKALALVAPSVGCEVNFENMSILARAFTSAVEQRNAAKQELTDYKQEVSDALYDYFGDADGAAWDTFTRFFIPKPDPLVEIVQKVGLPVYNPSRNWAGEIRAALEARGLEIREKNDEY